MKQNEDDRRLLCTRFDVCKKYTCHHIRPHKLFHDPNLGCTCGENGRCYSNKIFELNGIHARCVQVSGSVSEYKNREVESVDSHESYLAKWMD